MIRHVDLPDRGWFSLSQSALIHLQENQQSGRLPTTIASATGGPHTVHPTDPRISTLPSPLGCSGCRLPPKIPLPLPDSWSLDELGWSSSAMIRMTPKWPCPESNHPRRRAGHQGPLKLHGIEEV